MGYYYIQETVTNNSFFRKKEIILKITDIICLLGTNIKDLNKKYQVDVDKNGCYFLVPPKGIKRRIICTINSSGNIISIDFGYMRCNFIKKINKLQKHKKLTHNVVLEEYYRGAYSHG